MKHGQYMQLLYSMSLCFYFPDMTSFLSTDELLDLQCAAKMYKMLVTYVVKQLHIRLFNLLT